MRKIFSTLIVSIILSGCTSAPILEPKTVDQIRIEQLLSTAIDLNDAENWLAAENTWKQLAQQYQLFDQRSQQAIALHNQAFAMMKQGKYQQSLQPIEQALKIDNDTTTSEFYRHTLLLLQIQQLMGESQNIETLIQEAEENNLLEKDAHTYILLLSQLVSNQMANEQVESASITLQKALNLTQDRFLLLTLNINQAKVLEKQKNTEQALQLWLQNLEESKSLANKLFIAESLAGIGRAYLGLGQLERAKDYLLRSSQNFQLLGQPAQSQQTKKILDEI